MVWCLSPISTTGVRRVVRASSHPRSSKDDLQFQNGSTERPRRSPIVFNAKRLESVELAPAFYVCGVCRLKKRRQAARTPNASRFSTARTTRGKQLVSYRTFGHFDGELGEFSGAFEIELIFDVLLVVLDRFDAQAEFGRNFAGGFPLT
jgi:hypothetical protein